MARSNMRNEKLPKPPHYCLGDSVFTVPQYMPYNSPQSLKFRKMFEHQQFNSISKYLQDPEHRSSTFVQVPDRELKTPIFHNQAVLYLTPFALAIYFGNAYVAKYLAELKDENGENVTDVNGVCYATNVSQRKGRYGDILILYPFCIAIRRELWGIIPHLVRFGWKPHELIQLPSRTVYTCITITYTDYLDYALGQLASKPGLAIDRLLFALYKIHHPNFDIRKFEYVPKEKTVDNFSSIGKRMLRYSKYVDKGLRNFSQILNAVRVLCSVKFFRGPVHSIFGVDLFDRLRRLDAKEGWKMAEIQVFDQDSCIALLLGLIQVSVEKSLSNLERKSIVILLQILLHTHWIFFFFVYEGPVLLHYFKHLEDIDCDVIVFKRIRDTAINYTEVDSYHAQDLLYDFGAYTVRELLTDMVAKSKFLDKRETGFLDGKFTLDVLLRDAEKVSEEMEKQRRAATSEKRDIRGFTPSLIVHEKNKDELGDSSATTTDPSPNFLEELDEDSPNVGSQSESTRDAQHHSSVNLIEEPVVLEDDREKKAIVDDKTEEKEEGMSEDPEGEEQVKHQVEHEAVEEDEEQEGEKGQEKVEEEREDEEENQEVKEDGNIEEMTEEKEPEEEQEVKTTEKEKEGKTDEESSVEMKSDEESEEGEKKEEEEEDPLMRMRTRSDEDEVTTGKEDNESVASIGTISNHTASSPSARVEKPLKRRRFRRLFSCCFRRTDNTD